MESNNDLFPSFASPLHAFIDPVIHAPLIAPLNAGRNSNTWPSHLPRPEKPQATTPLLQSANNLFITAVGFAHLHEIAHIVLQHGWNDKEDEVQNEFAADEWAYTWMLEKVPFNTRREHYLARSIHISFALAIISSIAFLSLIHISEPTR